MKYYARLGLAAAILWTSGCVSHSDYLALEDRFHEQETYVVENKNQVREMERRQGVMTLRAKDQEHQLALYRTRLEKSEVLRKRLQGRLQSQPSPTALPAASPKAEAPPRVMGLEVNPETRGLVLQSQLLFAPGKAGLRNAGKTVLKTLMTELNKPEFAGRLVCIEGHTDDAPIKRSGHASNWDLSAKRALAVLRFLEAEGIASERLSFAGYGQFKPLEKGSGKRVRARNRRVELVLYEN
jgi:flagellar motor protein MotB